VEEKQWVFFFGEGASEGDPRRRDILGGKGASLAEMSRAGLPVPPGFTISAECCDYFFKHDGTWPPGLEEQVKAKLRRLEEVTGRTFGTGKKPLLVSVRSGAAQSMPGMMDTILNCGIHPGLSDVLGDTEHFWRVYLQFVTMFAKVVEEISPEEFSAAVEGPPCRAHAEKYLAIFKEKTGRDFPTEPWDMLAACIDAVFRSWNNDRAVTYREKNDIRGLLGTAVNVQAMFPSHVSGILFTKDPNDITANTMIIEASYGLGESVVSGNVSPDRFVVDRDDPSQVETTVGNKSEVVAALGDTEPWNPDEVTLSPEHIRTLCEIGKKVEAHFGMPMDIEWGLAEGKFSLLQCRKIRGLEIAEDVEKGRLEEIERLKSLAGENRKVWVMHNLAETLPYPTPLTWDIIRRFMSGNGGFGLLYRDLGYAPSKVVCEQGFLELICGRIYADPDRAAQLFWEHMPFTYKLEEIIQNKNVLESAPTTFDAAKAGPDFLFRLPRFFISLVKSSRTAKKLRKTADKVFDREVLPAYLSYIEEKRKLDLSALSPAELVRELHELNTRVMDEFGKESLKPGFFGGVALAETEQFLVQIMGDEGAALARTLVTGLDGDITVEQNSLLHRVARGEAGLDEFVDRFGHRAVGEMELAEPRWREDPSYLEQLAAAMKAAEAPSPEEIHRANKEKRLQAEEELPAVLEKQGGRSFLEDIRRSLADAQRLLPYRETGKYYLMMGYELMRRVIQELSARWDLGKGIYFLGLHELERFEKEREKLLKTIEKRKIRWQSAKRLDMPDVIDSDDLENLGLPRTFEDATEFKGEGVASGVASGPARIVFDPRQAGDLGTGYILVCPSTDPGWTSLFVHAAGLVVERGGILSHGAIVARDFGIPAVVFPGATSRIRDGEVIRVDGTRGEITVIDGGSPHA